MTFRLRLFLAMLLLVAAVTGAALSIAERSMSAAFARALDARFEERAIRVASVREARAEEARGVAEAITRSVRLQAALIEHAEDRDAMPGGVVHEIARNALDERKKTGASWALRLVDRAGRLIEGAEELGGTSVQLVWQPEPERVADVLKAGTTTRGLLPARSERGWWEAQLSPILDAESGEPLGGVMLAQSGADLMSAGTGTAAVSTPDRDEQRSAVVIDGRVVSTGWEAEAARTVIALSDGSTRRALAPLDGVSHILFVRPIGDHGPGIFPPAMEVTAFSLAENERQRRALRSKVLIAGVLALAAAVLIANTLAGGLAKPVRELVSVTDAIRRGDYSVRATPRSGELGALATAFNTMAGDLALKDRYRSMLDLVSDPHIAEDLIAGGLELGGEERDVSVVFCDIRGFTALSEGMEPKAVIEMLNEHFTPLTRVVYEHGGVVLHFVGDLIIALFGAPRVHAHGERSAAACALGLVAERARLNEAGGRKIEVGVGVATGRVVAGRMGSKDRLNYSVFGARMNLASRLCSQAGPMQVVIDAPTLAGCGPAVRAAALGALKLKGFTEEIEAYRLDELG